MTHNQHNIDLSFQHLRLQMAVHRLLQRGFARLYRYKLEGSDKAGGHGESDAIVDFDHTALHCDSSRELHFKMKGARF